MTALASVLLVLAAVTALGLVVAITWKNVDLLLVENRRLRRENAQYAELLAEAEHELDTRDWAHQDEQVLARHHTAAAHEGLLPRERWN